MQPYQAEGEVLPQAWTEPDPHFVSLGMVVLDELHFPSRDTIYNVTGGSGAYSTLGARITVAPEEAKRIGCIILVGDDFPEDVLNEIRAWGVYLCIRRIAGQNSTRGLLKYEDDKFGRKSFRYLTDLLQPVPQDLEGSNLLRSAAFHLLAAPVDLDRWVTALLALRSRGPYSERPLIIWEPAPLHCKKENLEVHLLACGLVDVFSPNHLELIQLFKEDVPYETSLDREVIETYAYRCLEASNGRLAGSTNIVIRAGEHGAMIVAKFAKCKWYPPFHDPVSLKTVDTTGAGNMFLGAFAITLCKTGDIYEAAVYGSVAASFAVEQIGLPKRGVEGASETWNSTTFQSRLLEYRSKLQ